ncbi:MAG: hypothetical protein H7A49_04760 [Akkermansiaceae bacterium]|nr:hypothetical protein [Akkermansiaceae bacterium]
MKPIALILAFTTVVSWATGTRWVTVYLPTHVLFVDEGSAGGMTNVPCVDSSSATFERTISLLNSPYVPHHSRWNIPSDTNLITLYGLSVSGAYDPRSDPKNPKLVITIDLAKASRPADYPFTINEVLEQVKECVKLNFDGAAIEVLLRKEKEEEQGAVPQSAPRSEPDSAGGENPQHESEERPR